MQEVETIEVHEITMTISIIRERDGNPADWPWAEMLELDTYHDDVGVNIKQDKIVDTFTVNRERGDY